MILNPSEPCEGLHLHNPRGHQTANMRSWGWQRGQGTGHCGWPSRACQECSHGLKLTRAHNTEAISASCFYAGFREDHSRSKLKVVWAGGTQLQSNNCRYKVLKNFLRISKLVELICSKLMGLFCSWDFCVCIGALKPDLLNWQCRVFVIITEEDLST